MVGITTSDRDVFSGDHPRRIIYIKIKILILIFFPPEPKIFLKIVRTAAYE